MIDRLEQIEALTKDRQRMLLEMDGLRARVEELEAEAAGVDAGIGSMAIVNDNLKARVSELEARNKRMQESLAAGRELQHFTAEGTRLATLDRAADAVSEALACREDPLAAIRALKDKTL